MQLAEALKKIRTEKPKENFMLLEFGYGHKFVLSYEKGISVMAALTTAEALVDEYGSKKRISECPRDHIKSSIFSYQEYERYKLSVLLNLTFDEVKELMEAQNKPPEPVTT